jgi:hypothetical protein
MKIHVLTRFAILLLAAAGLLAGGCWGRGPSRVHPRAIASDAAQKAMELYDTDKDGSIDGAELDKVPGLKASMATVDSNHDGRISPDEINARIQAWNSSPLGRLPLRVTVTRNGKPLADATVTFVPESFLGDGLKPGSGKTGPSGQAIVAPPSSGPDDPAGLSPGFYRVEITKEGEAIPAKYNTETTLGQEVAADADIRHGVTFDLRY